MLTVELANVETNHHFLQNHLVMDRESSEKKKREHVV